MRSVNRQHRLSALGADLSHLQGDLTGCPHLLSQAQKREQKPWVLIKNACIYFKTCICQDLVDPDALALENPSFWGNRREELDCVELGKFLGGTHYNPISKRGYTSMADWTKNKWCQPIIAKRVHGWESHCKKPLVISRRKKKETMHTVIFCSQRGMYRTVVGVERKTTAYPDGNGGGGDRQRAYDFITCIFWGL